MDIRGHAVTSGSQVVWCSSWLSWRFSSHLYGRDHVNPPVGAEPIWDSPGTRALAKQACFDCHSNETEWPADPRVAPVSWLIQRDVSEGRAVLNFSEWSRPQQEATDASEEVLEGDMPPAAYTLVHAHARLNAAERDRLAQGLARSLGVALNRRRADVTDSPVLRERLR